MKMRTVELTVGALMIAGILSLLMLTLQVSGLNTAFKAEKGYRVSADFSNIGGLKVRAKVSVAGVVVGRVVSIGLEPHSFNAKVVILLDPKQGKLPADTRASIMTAGLLGDNYIALSPGYDEESLENKGSIPLENTDSAIVLEQLISKFVANQASGSESNNSSVPEFDVPTSSDNHENKKSVDIEGNNKQKPSKSIERSTVDPSNDKK